MVCRYIWKQILQMDALLVVYIEMCESSSCWTVLKVILLHCNSHIGNNGRDKIKINHERDDLY